MSMEDLNEGMSVCKDALKTACEGCAYFYETKDKMKLCIKKEERIHKFEDSCNKWMDERKLRVKRRRVRAVPYEEAFHKTDNFLLREQLERKKKDEKSDK